LGLAWGLRWVHHFLGSSLFNEKERRKKKKKKHIIHIRKVRRKERTNINNETVKENMLFYDS